MKTSLEILQDMHTTAGEILDCIKILHHKIISEELTYKVSVNLFGIFAKSSLKHQHNIFIHKMAVKRFEERYNNLIRKISENIL